MEHPDFLTYINYTDNGSLHELHSVSMSHKHQQSSMHIESQHGTKCNSRLTYRSRLRSWVCKASVAHIPGHLAACTQSTLSYDISSISSGHSVISITQVLMWQALAIIDVSQD